MSTEAPWRSWHLISAREPRPDTCDHGRPDHQALVRQLAEALGLDIPALPLSPETVWNGLLDEVERLRRHPPVPDTGAEPDFHCEHRLDSNGRCFYCGAKPAPDTGAEA